MVDGVLNFPQVIWLRQVVGDGGTAVIGFVLAALVILFLASELWRARLMHRQRRAYRRLTEHCNGCPACQQLMDAEADDGGSYCPVGQQLEADCERT
jgi:hypothetical protein